MKVFYRPEQVANTASVSRSALKPQLVIEDWALQADIQFEVVSFEPLTAEDFHVAHHPYFVKGVLGGHLANGFGNTDPEVAKSLLYTTGSMFAAAQWAVQHQGAACSPTSGFHHAGYRKAEGFCTFNGLMVTALLLKKLGLVENVAILDCDAHYGNGTDNIMSVLNIDWIEHQTQGALFTYFDDAKNGAYETWLDNAITKCEASDIILYQAGADPHINDPFGGILSSEQMYARDKQVFERLGHKPLVWNLAGGYQTAPGITEREQLEPVLALHRATARLHNAILD